MDHAAELIADNDALADLVADADDWSIDVPTCPGWTVLQLVKHVGRGHRWAAQMVADRAEHPLDLRAVEGGRPPDDRDGAVAWLRDGAQDVVDAVRLVGADTPIWTFTGPKPASWWLRRRLHETAVHRADAAIALGTTYETADDLAADGVAEWLHLMAARPRDDDGTSPLDVGTTLALVADHGASWVLRGTADGVRVEPGRGEADATVSASATDLLLAISRRTDDVSVSGDETIWSTWLARTGF